MTAVATSSVVDPRRLRVDTFCGLVLASGAQIAIALTYLLAARNATPAEFGASVAAIGLLFSAIGVIDFGAGSHTAREVALGRMTVPHAVTRLSTRVLVLAVVSVALVVACWQQNLISGLGAVALWVMAVATGSSLGIQSILRGLGMVRRASVLNVVDRWTGLLAIALALIVSAPTHPRDLLIGAVCIGPLLASGLGFYWIPQAGLLPTLSHPYRGTLSFGITSSVTSVQTLDVSILNWAAGTTAGGEFGAVSRWIGPLNIAIGSYTQTVFATLARESSMRSAVRRVLSTAWILVLSWLMAISVALLSPWIVELLLGSDYSKSAPVLTVMALTTIPSSLSQVALILLQARGDDRGGAGRVVLGVALQLGSVAVGSLLFRSLGGAYAILATQALLALLLLSRVRSLVWLEKGADARGADVEEH